MVALKTFTNLSEERKQEIILVCLEEFALHDFQSASLSVIIKKLKLAKGSFYRYFESKKTLYYFLLEHCVQLRLENDARYIQNIPTDFFDLTLLHFKAKIQFDKTEALPSAFLNNALYEKNSEKLGNIQFIRMQKALQIIEKLLTKYRESNELRGDIDIDIMAWHVLQSQLSIHEFIGHKFHQNFRENIKSEKRLYNIPEDELLKSASQFIELQKNGLTK